MRKYQGWRGGQENREPTEQQLEIMTCIVNGATQYAEIAEQLGIGTETVRTQLSRLYARIDVGSMTEAVYVLASRGLLDVWSS